MSNYKQLSLEKSCLVDFLTHRAFIQEKLSEGYSRHSIWKGLFDAKMIDMTYSYFLRLCRAQLQEKSRNAPRKALHADHIIQKSDETPPTQDSPAPSRPSAVVEEKDGSYMLGGFKMDPNRPKRAAVDMPKAFEWNPVPLTKEEISTGKITSR
jgi:hypothetical protein